MNTKQALQGTACNWTHRGQTVKSSCPVHRRAPLAWSRHCTLRPTCPFPVLESTSGPLAGLVESPRSSTSGLYLSKLGLCWKGPCYQIPVLCVSGGHRGELGSHSGLSKLNQGHRVASLQSQRPPELTRTREAAHQGPCRVSRHLWRPRQRAGPLQPGGPTPRLRNQRATGLPETETDTHGDMHTAGGEECNNTLMFT